MPKRDLLPSAGRDHFTKQLDETYERGFHLGRAAGLEKACEVLRNMPHSALIVEALEELTRAKYDHT